jgi:FKBP-type peptidyl-prolyl cis-trans isomerase
MLVLVLVAGCGGGSKTTAGATTSTTAAHQKRIFGIAERYPKPANPGPHPGANVTSLVVKDVHRGTGDVLHAGDSGWFDFIATNWVTGKLLESSWRRPRPFESRVEHNVVIDGWWQGLPGMRVGGERQLIIPPSLGFTTNPNPEIKEATTYYDVVLLAVIPAQPAGVPGAGGAQGAPSGSELSSAG